MANTKKTTKSKKVNTEKAEVQETKPAAEKPEKGSLASFDRD